MGLREGTEIGQTCRGGLVLLLQLGCFLKKLLPILGTPKSRSNKSSSRPFLNTEILSTCIRICFEFHQELRTNFHW